MTAQCSDTVLVDVGSHVGLVIQCGRDRGHEGNHSGVTDSGIGEWSRIERVPQQCPDESVPF